MAQLCAAVLVYMSAFFLKLSVGVGQSNKVLTLKRCRTEKFRLFGVSAILFQSLSLFLFSLCFVLSILFSGESSRTPKAQNFELTKTMSGLTRAYGLLANLKFFTIHEHSLKRALG
jgi:hypothetical protein